MAKRKKSSTHGEAEDLSNRAACEFYETRPYKRTLHELEREDAPMVGAIRADVVKFQGVWRRSRPGQPLPKAFHFKMLGRVPGEYRVCQIYVGYSNFRVAMLFIHAGTRAYMVDAWKKTKQINRNEVRVALDRAAAVWEELVNEGKERRGTRGKG